MKKLLIALILLNSLTLFSQDIEIIGGLSKNSFFDYRDGYAHYESSYKSDYGYAFRMGIEDIKFNWLKLRLTLSLDRYGGELDAYDGGQGGGSGTIATIEKSVISIGVFPINFNLFKRIDVNFGFELAGLINENNSGTINSWNGPDRWSFDLNERYDRYCSRMVFGLRGRIAYDFNISDKLVLSPQYSYYYGLTREFGEFPWPTKSMRHYFCVGLQRKI